MSKEIKTLKIMKEIERILAKQKFIIMKKKFSQILTNLRNSLRINLLKTIIRVSILEVLEVRALLKSLPTLVRMKKVMINIED